MVPRLSAAAMLLLILASGPAWGQGFNRIYTQDGVDVWAVGDAGTVYRSLDGGATWGSYPLGGADHRGVAARGMNVWIVDAAGNLWTSTDAGHSFTTTQPAAGSPLYAAWFADDDTGWIAGAGGTILCTTDAGATWSVQASGTGADLFAVRFRTALEGWACGGGGTVAHTTDGGATWTATTPFTFGKNLHDIDYDGGSVYVVGTLGFFARSADAGASWTPVDLRIASRIDVDGVAVAPGGAVWLCGGGGFLRRSTNAGRTWTYPQHKVMSGLTSVYFHDADRGWACAGKSKLVARTTDGGATWTIPGGGSFTYTWTQKVSNSGATIRGNTLVIDARNRNKLYCVQGKTVYASWNLGETWTSIATISGSGSRTNAFLVSATDSLTWLALVQDGDRVTRTTDGGATWTTTIAKAFTEYGLPLEQDPNKPDDVYFGPEDGKMWKSTDFGATWFELSAPGFRSPDDIVVVPDSSAILYVGDGVTGSGSGEVWKSANGGLTFALKRTVSGSEIPTIAASWLDNRIAYSTSWSSGGVQRTLDMGDTWPNVTSTSSAWGVDIAKDDPYVAMFAVYSGGRSYLTADNGATWQSGVVSGANYAVLAYDRGTFLLHQSNGIWKATVTQPGMPVENAQLLSLVAPNGGEMWHYNTSESITWTSQNLARVRLEYRVDPLGPWHLIQASAQGPAGAYAWLVPDAPTTQALVRASDPNDGTPIDESDAAFTILVPELASAESRLEFGAVPIGESRTDTLHLTNTGTTTVVIASASVAGSGPFTPLRTSFSIAPGGQEVLPVVFEPPAEVAYEDTLVILSNAPKPQLEILLLGAGAPPVAVPPGFATVTDFALADAAPNPFGTRGTVIAYALPRASDVRLVVYNALGQVVTRLVQARQGPGRYAVRFPSAGLNLSSGYANALPSGVYFYRLDTGTRVITKQMVYVR